MKLMSSFGRSAGAASMEKKRPWSGMIHSCVLRSTIARGVATALSQRQKLIAGPSSSDF